MKSTIINVINEAEKIFENHDLYEVVRQECKWLKNRLDIDSAKKLNQISYEEIQILEETCNYWVHQGIPTKDEKIQHGTILIIFYTLLNFKTITMKEE